MDMMNVFYNVLGFLGKGIVVIGAYYVGRHFSDINKSKWINYLIVLAIVFFVSVTAWGSYGTHTEDSDPIYGGGETITDFEPSENAKSEYGLTIFFVLLIPAILGVYKGKK